jgi:hypothetical protein
MPFENDAQRAERKAAKAERARELAERRRQIEQAVQERCLAALAAQFVRGYDELGALLHVSGRQAFAVAGRPDFPRSRSISSGVRLWPVREVIDWIEAQP